MTEDFSTVMKIMKFADNLMELEKILLNGVAQAQGDYSMFSHRRIHNTYLLFCLFNKENKWMPEN